MWLNSRIPYSLGLFSRTLLALQVFGLLTACSTLNGDLFYGTPERALEAGSTGDHCNSETVSNKLGEHGGRKLTMLPAPKIELTPEVRRELEIYTSENSSFISGAISRRQQFLPTIEQIFIDEGVPPQLLNVALIESGFRPTAKSHAGAVGLWQFMKSTARLYGLEVSRAEDQRHDPILSSIAAARHLRDLYLSYNDWLLALAAYNAGSGSIDRALIRTGASDFWTLARKSKKSKLRKETLRYVPRFMAITWALENDERFSTKAIG